MRRWLQFRVSTLFWSVIAIGLALGWWRDHAEMEQKVRVAELSREATRLVHETAAERSETRTQRVYQVAGAAAGSVSSESAVEPLKEYIAGREKPTIYKPTTRKITQVVSVGLVYELGRAIPTEGAIEELSVMLAEGSREQRACAARTLTEFGEASAPAVPALTAALRDEDAVVRQHAAIALRCVGKESHPAVPALIELLSDDHASVRRSSVYTLARIGAPQAEPAVAKLFKLLADPDCDVRTAAMTAVSELAIWEQALAALTKAFANEHDADARLHAAKIIDRLDGRH
jgi:HEAT repeat protein